MVYVAIWDQEKIVINLVKKSQIKDYSKVQANAYVKLLLFNKSSTEILAEYSNYGNIFPTKNIVELSKYTRINNHIIKLEKNKQLYLSPIYSQRLVKLETLKIYINTNLANGFIRHFKFFVEASILFDWKSNRSFQFYVNYWGLKNLTIKN